MLKQSSFSLPHSHSVSTYTTVPMVWEGLLHCVLISFPFAQLQWWYKGLALGHSRSLPKCTQHWWCIFILCALSTFLLYIHNHKRWCRLLLPDAVHIPSLFQYCVCGLRLLIIVLFTSVFSYTNVLMFWGPRYLSSLYPLFSYSTAPMGWESFIDHIHITSLVALMHWWGRVCLCSFYNLYNETNGGILLLLIWFIGPFLLLCHHCTDGAWLLLAPFSTLPR